MSEHPFRAGVERREALRRAPEIVDLDARRLAAGGAVSNVAGGEARGHRLEWIAGVVVSWMIAGGLIAAAVYFR